MIGWMKRLIGFGPSPRETTLNRLRTDLSNAEKEIRQIKARYDAAVNNDETLGLWSRADNLSARTANTLEVRRQLRQRSRHEAANGSHMRGITLTLANDLIGTGPRLHILLDDEKSCDRIENAWNEWAEEICLAEKLHTFALAKVVDGEAVAQIITNPDLYSSVKLDLQVIECDRLSTPWHVANTLDLLVDGIVFDNYGRPKAYHLLDQHPADLGYFGEPTYKTVPARNILHWFRVDRPMQARGIPELTPALLIFGHLREYAAAVLTAARVAACISAIVHTKAMPDGGFVSSEFSATDLEPGMMIGAPDGYDVTQMRAEQPTTTYDVYERRKLSEACHCCCLPYSLATGDFSQESYAGGRMARQVYYSSVGVQRNHLGGRGLNRLFGAWLDEATRIPGLLPEDISAYGHNVPHAWFFDPWEHIDEVKAATAITTNLSNNTTTLAEECARRGKDWRKVLRQRGKEIALAKEQDCYVLPKGVQEPVDDGEASDAAQKQTA